MKRIELLTQFFKEEQRLLATLEGASDALMVYKFGLLSADPSIRSQVVSKMVAAAKGQERPTWDSELLSLLLKEELVGMIANTSYAPVLLSFLRARHENTLSELPPSSTAAWKGLDTTTPWVWVGSAVGQLVKSHHHGLAAVLLSSCLSPGGSLCTAGGGLVLLHRFLAWLVALESTEPLSASLILARATAVPAFKILEQDCPALFRN